jgi:hypothetical protein
LKNRIEKELKKKEEQDARMEELVGKDRKNKEV